MNIICDLDGTISLDHNRNHHLHREGCPRKHNYTKAECVCLTHERDWDSYFDACDTDDPQRHIIQLLQNLHMIHRIFILSGRSLSSHKKTLTWMTHYGVPYHHLQMRPVTDRTQDNELKIRWASQLNLTPKNTLFVLEDRNRVVDAWRDAGFLCLQVAPGDF